MTLVKECRHQAWLCPSGATVTLGKPLSCLLSQLHLQTEGAGQIQCPALMRDSGIFLCVCQFAFGRPNSRKEPTPILSFRVCVKPLPYRLWIRRNLKGIWRLILQDTCVSLQCSHCTQCRMSADWHVPRSSDRSRLNKSCVRPEYIICFVYILS